MAERADEDRPGFRFDPGAPEEVSAFFRDKGLRETDRWDEWLPEEHAVSFTVARSLEQDVLGDIAEELQSAIDEGRGIDEFVRSLRPRLEAKGWWGRTEGDGGDREVELGTPRRLRTIYRANVRSAYAAGQWGRIERTKSVLPFLEYRLGPSLVHRPDHLAKEGLVLRADDPFWRRWMPPNGWGCKCWVRQLSRRAAEALGIDLAPEVQMTTYTDSQGRDRQVPRGIDPGWDGNPGAARLAARREELAAKEARRRGQAPSGGHGPDEPVR
jgi:uncharacterized protein with gpF-like domain